MVGLGLAGLATIAVAAVVGERELVLLLEPARKPLGDAGVIVQATPSPDGAWIAIERWSDAPSHAVVLVECASGTARDVALATPGAARDEEYTPPRVEEWSTDGLLCLRADDAGAGRIWLDPRTLAPVRTDAPAAESTPGRARTGSDGWSQRTGIVVDGRAQWHVAWPARALSRRFEADAGTTLRTCCAPGLVFVARRTEHETVLACEPLDGEARELARVGQDAGWSPSPDGERLIVVDRGRLEVRDARDGSLVSSTDGIASARWIGTGSRWLAAVAGRALVLHDLEAQTSRVLFEEADRWHVQVLADERVLAVLDDQVLLFEKQGSTPRRIHPSAQRRS